MFTGLIQKKGKVRRVSHGAGIVLEVAFEPWPRVLEEGESIAVNGVCLTVARFDQTHFTANVLAETAAKSGIGELVPGEEVNLERALRAGDYMGGHVVQGHVQARGRIVAKLPRGRDFALKIDTGYVIAAQCVEKGSIAIDGVSLTISGLGRDWVQVDIIPTTAAATTLGAKRIGQKVNIETDILTRRAEATPQKISASGLTMEMLAENGFI
ncbi:MAG: riboflavin synthase [Kiritimatiellae bacterium]|nr:riboflavin synthase [Kiritimatiellia bacterium]